MRPGCGGVYGGGIVRPSGQDGSFPAPDGPQETVLHLGEHADLVIRHAEVVEGERGLYRLLAVVLDLLLDCVFVAGYRDLVTACHLRLVSSCVEGMVFLS